MLISILDNEHIAKFNLPENSEETYLIKYRPIGANIEKDLNLVSKNNQWYIKSNGSIDAVVDNKIVDEKLLELHSKCLLSVSGQKIYSILYCSSYSEKTIKYSIGNLTKYAFAKSRSIFFIVSGQNFFIYQCKIKSGIFFMVGNFMSISFRFFT